MKTEPIPPLAPAALPPRRSWAIRAAEAFMAASMAVMVLAVFSNVVLRYGFNTGFASYEELARILFIWLVAIGAIVAAAEGKHLGFDMLTSRLSGRAALALLWVSRLLVAFGLVLLAQGSWNQVEAGLQSFSTVMGYPLALAAASTLVLAVGMLAVVVMELVRGRAIAPDDETSLE